MKKPSIFRKRNVMLFLGMFLVPLIIMLTSPEAGLFDLPGPLADVLGYLTYVIRIFLIIVIWHVLRKTLFDYEESDFRGLLKNSILNKQHGLAMIAISIMMLSVSIVIAAVLLAG